MISYQLTSLIDELIGLQKSLTSSLKEETHSIWMPGINPNEDAEKGTFYAAADYPEYLQHAIQAINSIEYSDGQGGTETKKQRGVLLVGPRSLEVAIEINRVKTSLAQEFTTLRSSFNSKKIKISDVLKTDDSIRKALARAGIGRLCVNQARRALPLTEKAPSRISWLEKRSDSVTKVTAKEAAARISKLSSEQAQIDLERVATLPEQQVLAIVQQPKVPTIKATMYFPDIIDGKKTTANKQIHAPVPIICATGHEMPVLNKGGRRRNTRRSDQTICNETFLPSIRAHLYLCDSPGV